MTFVGVLKHIHKLEQIATLDGVLKHGMNVYLMLFGHTNLHDELTSCRQIQCVFFFVLQINRNDMYTHK